jgi:DNA helicase-2/ATP-dependent DNA helicase PcrA
MHLNDNQKTCVNHIEGPLLVLAGAGSGKTRVVTERIAHLIHLGVPSSEIVAVTFTNKAAREMAHRIQLATEQYVLASTFHSLCTRILRESIHVLGYKSSFVIFDQQDSENLIKLCLKNRDIDEENISAKEIKFAISNAKNELRLPEHFLELKDSFIKGPFLDIYTDYQTRLKEYNALDFDDLLLLTVKLLQEHESIKALYQERFQFLLVDEYQDTNKAQYELIKLLVEKHRNIFAVGDPDQSIYSFRGANIYNILNFEKDFPGAQIITLDQNYRSTQTILKAANALIENNSKRYEKTLISECEVGEKIQLYGGNSDHEESRWVLKNIEYLKTQKNINLSDIAIFYRTNAQSRSYEDELIKWGIPYQIIGGTSFYQRKEIKDVLAFLKLLVFEFDYIAFDRTINIPKRGFGQATLQNMFDLSRSEKVSIIELCHRIIRGELTHKIRLNSKQAAGLHDYLYARSEALKLIEAPFRELISNTLLLFHYMDHLKQDPESYEDRKANVQELINKAIQFNKENPAHTLQDFLEELSLRGNQDEESANEEKVKLMTFHNSKGLEFPAVFMVGMEEDLFPHINAKDSQDQLEEERRLCYVGMTRAKKHLMMSFSKYRLVWGNPRVMQESRFLSEIPQELITSNQRSFRSTPTIPTFSSKESDTTSDFEFPPGTKVVHKTFGLGTVKKAYQGSLGLTYDVYFSNLSEQKTLVAKFAKLTKNV